MWWFSLLCSIVCWGKGESKSGPPPWPVGPPPRACPIFAFPLMAKFSPKVPLHFSCCTFVFRPPILSNQKRNDDNPLIQQSIVLLRYLCTAQQCTHDTGTHTHARQDLEKYFQILDQNKQVLTELDPWHLSNNCYQLFSTFRAILAISDSLVKAPVIPLSRRAPPKVNKEHLSSTLSDILTYDKSLTGHYS